MFNLEQTIAVWRRQMRAAGIKTPVPLEELEMHLRDEIERQTKSGVSEAEAFNAAAQKIGRASMLKQEFAKAGCTKAPLLQRMVMAVAAANIVFGACWVFLGLHTVWSMWHTLRLHPQWDPGDVLYLGFAWGTEVYGAICGAIAIVAAIQIFSHRRLGITLTAAISALTILGVLVDAAWRFPQFGFRAGFVFVFGLSLLYPVLVLVLCQNSELKKQYV